MSEPTTEDLLIRPRLGDGEKTATDMTIIARAEALGGDFTIMQGRIGPKRLLPPHTHTYEDQAVYLIEGTLEFEVGGEGGLRFRAEKGDWVLKPRGIQHTFWNPSEDVTVQYIELSGKDGFEKFVDGRAKGAGPPPTPQTRRKRDEQRRSESAPPDGRTAPDAVCKSNLQPDFNVRVCECFDTSTSAVLRELAESNRFVQKSAESTSI